MRIVKSKEKKGCSEVKFVGEPKPYRAGGSFEEAVLFTYIYVDPDTGIINKNKNKNSQFVIWAEAGPWHDRSQDEIIPPKEGWNEYNKWIPSHDPRLDCSGSTMQEVLINLAGLVEKFYNEDGTERK